MTRGQCKSCGASILWVKTLGGRAMPLDAEPVPDGNVVVHNKTCVVLTKEQQGDTDLKGTGPRYQSHFATCSQAAKHRRTS